jgi:hypothetical protein
MKNWKQIAFVAIIVIVGIIIGFMACNNDNETTHVHQWGDWIETTPATLTGNPLVETDGVETRTCSICGEKETRPISFRSYFYGIWSHSTLGDVTINADLLFVAENENLIFKFNNPTWTAYGNDTNETKGEYTFGYSLSGIASEDSISTLAGTQFSHSFYINADKNKLCKDGFSDQIFIKQSN